MGCSPTRWWPRACWTGWSTAPTTCAWRAAATDPTSDPALPSPPRRQEVPRDRTRVLGARFGEEPPGRFPELPQPMASSDDRPSGVLELARSATPVTRRRVAALAAVARPAGEVAALLLVEILGRPRARAAALALARSLARRVADRR